MLHSKPNVQYSLCCGKQNLRLANKIKQILNGGRSSFDRQIHLKLWSVYATTDTILFSFCVSLYSWILTEFFFFRSVPTNKNFKKLLELEHSLGFLWKKTKCACRDIFRKDLFLASYIITPFSPEKSFPKTSKLIWSKRSEKGKYYVRFRDMTLKTKKTFFLIW